METAVIPSPYVCEPKVPPLENYLNRVARNHARILNHLPLLRRKIDIGKRLGLVEHEGLAPATFEANMAALTQLQHDECTVSEILPELAARAGFGDDRSATQEYASLVDELTHAGHIELHPTDICDHKCVACYYADKGTATMPIEKFEEIPALVRPRSIVLVGGGEPGLYKNGPHRLGDAIDRIVSTDRNIQLGMVTKGTNIPRGDWQQYLQWIRISFDAATPDMFETMKKRDAFDLVLKNFFSYLSGPIPHVGTGFLYCSVNIHETAAFAEMIYRQVMEHAPELISKANIQYRPLRPAPDFPEKRRKGHVDLTWLCPDDQVRRAIAAFESLYERDEDMRLFLQTATNWQKVGEGNDMRASRPFDRCYYSLLFRLYRPDGDVFPCFVRVNDPAYRLGQAFGLPEEERLRINLVTFLAYNRQLPYCCPERCRMCWVNHPAAEGFHGRLSPPEGDAAESSFF